MIFIILYLHLAHEWTFKLFLGPFVCITAWFLHDLGQLSNRETIQQDTPHPVNQYHPQLPYPTHLPYPPQLWFPPSVPVSPAIPRIPIYPPAWMVLAGTQSTDSTYRSFEILYCFVHEMMIYYLYGNLTFTPVRVGLTTSCLIMKCQCKSPCFF